MRLLRIRLANYRGVAEREVQFAERGVTVVEGPNESGKSSTIEALGLLLDEYDSSTKRSVLAIRPRHRDASPEVEAEFTTGRYHLVYKKRWYKGAHTELRISAPDPSTLVGREAHDRVRAILEESMDYGLFEALRVLQDESFDVRKLAGSTSLRRALDLAAGGSGPGDGAEDSLLQRVQTEVETYFTKQTRKPHGEYRAAQEAVDEAERRADELKVRLDGIDRDAELHAQLSAQLAEIREGLQKDRAEASECQRQAEAIVKLRERSDKAALELAAAQRDEQAAAILLQARRTLTADVDRLRADLDAADLARQGLDLRKQDVDLRCEKESAKHKRADEVHGDARRLLDVAEADLRWLRDQHDLARVIGDRQALADADHAVSKAAEALGAAEIDDQLVDGIEVADREVRAAETKMETAAATVRIENLSAEPVRIGNTTLVGDLAEVQRITEHLVIEAPGVLRVTLGPGASERELRATLDTARHTLVELCGLAGVRDLASARVRQSDAVAARTALASAETARARISTDAAALSQLQAKLETRIADYERLRDADTLPPSGLDEAEAVVTSGRRLVDEAVAELALAETALQTAVAEANALAQEVHKLAGSRERLLAEQLGASEKLAAARAERPDADIEARHRESAEVLAAAQDVQFRSVAAYREAVPEQVDFKLANARAVVERVEREVKHKEADLQLLTGRLSADGNDGLAEQYFTAVSHLAADRRALAALTARAEAARLLHDVLVKRRDEATKAYQGPFKERVEQFGRWLYGVSDFTVEVDDKLDVTQRTMNGRTDPYAELSTGAREQLAMCVRLACASLVSADGGVPVVIDDALGAADPLRRRQLGALLNHAGETTQIIVFTCDPERYRTVGSAQVRSLGQNDVRDTATAPDGPSDSQ